MLCTWVYIGIRGKSEKLSHEMGGVYQGQWQGEAKLPHGEETIYDPARAFCVGVHLCFPRNDERKKGLEFVKRGWFEYGLLY